MNTPAISALIQPEELHALTMSGSDKIVILDATYGLPGHPVTTSMRFAQNHIAGAQFFDIDVVAAPDAAIPHTVPSADIFQDHARHFGIDEDTHVIVYDQNGLWMAAARAWWMFRLFGHNNVRVLNGGLKSWESHYYPTESGEISVKTQGNFTAHLQTNLLKHYDDIKNNQVTPVFTVLDVRPAAAFDQGHIEGAINAPFPALINHASATMKSSQDIQSILEPFIESGKPIVTSCGSGVIACVTALALYEIGIFDVAVYGGSWVDWAYRS